MFHIMYLRTNCVTDMLLERIGETPLQQSVNDSHFSQRITGDEFWYQLIGIN